MPMTIATFTTPGAALAYRLTRLDDLLRFDFADGTFKSSPGTPDRTLPPASGRPGVYLERLTPTPIAQFPDGDYLAEIVSTSALDNFAAVAGLIRRMVDGDDAPQDVPIPRGAVESGTTAEVIRGTGANLCALAGAYNGATLMIATGPLRSAKRLITTHAVAAGIHTFTLTGALPAAPAAGVRFLIG